MVPAQNQQKIIMSMCFNVVPVVIRHSLHVVFITPDGQKKRVPALEGQTILETAHANDVDLEGACEASLACSTCHVILPGNWYEKLPNPVEEEEDMLDLAFGLTETYECFIIMSGGTDMCSSRLGCQVVLTKDMNDMEIKMPAATRNMAVDGFKPKPH